MKKRSCCQLVFSLYFWVCTTKERPPKWTGDFFCRTWLLPGKKLESAKSSSMKISLLGSWRMIWLCFAFVSLFAFNDILGWCPLFRREGWSYRLSSRLSPKQDEGFCGNDWAPLWWVTCTAWKSTLTLSKVGEILEHNTLDLRRHCKRQR